MKTKYYNRYSFEELLAKATSPEAEQIDIDTLGAWFVDYGYQYWNGEYFDADDIRLYPVYTFHDPDAGLVGYEIR